jgi:hypothetical protein
MEPGYTDTGETERGDVDPSDRERLPLTLAETEAGPPPGETLAGDLLCDGETDDGDGETDDGDAEMDDGTDTGIPPATQHVVAKSGKP